jgi:hypothetical protein
MTRKESEKESERPHYYSQFWLDVAAGRRIIGTPKPGSEEAEASEQETVEHILPRKTGRTSNHSDGIPVPDGHTERIAHPVVEPEVMAEDEFIEPTAEDLDLELQDEDEVLPPEAGIEDIEAPDMDLDLAEDDEEDLLEEEEEEEDEEDLGWSGRGRKKPTPKRPTRQPPKKPKRDRRTY